MRHPCLMAFLLLFPLGGRPAASAQAPPANQGGPKAPEITSKRLQEGYDKLKAGMTVGQLTELLGPLTSIKAPGDPICADCEQELRWTDRSTVKVTLKGGKVTEVFAEVSPTLVFEHVTQDNVLKLLPGMTEQEVVGILGGGHWSQDGKDGGKVLGWTPMVSVTVQLTQGKFGTAKGMESSSFTLP